MARQFLATLFAVFLVHTFSLAQDLALTGGTLLTITTTVLIMVLKVFDIIFVMTSGQNETEVIANRMFREMFTFRNFGRSGALAMVLLLAVIPVMIYNVRSLNSARR